ncbi:MAG: D-glycerate 3-kinase [Cellvibrionaceae bacterium]|jgi:D-glycerate 3-kinase
MDDPELQRFIEHYQRLTEHMLYYSPQQKNVFFQLNAEHKITGRTGNGGQ